jgi:hypothetical protein
MRPGRLYGKVFPLHASGRADVVQLRVWARPEMVEVGEKCKVKVVPGSKNQREIGFLSQTKNVQNCFFWIPHQCTNYVLIPRSGPPRHCPTSGGGTLEGDHLGPMVRDLVEGVVGGGKVAWGSCTGLVVGREASCGWERQASKAPF